MCWGVFNIVDDSGWNIVFQGYWSMKNIVEFYLITELLKYILQ